MGSVAAAALGRAARQRCGLCCGILPGGFRLRVRAASGLETVQKTAARCSHLAMRGALPRAIQELAGHRELGMTQRYIHLSPGALESAIRLLDQPLTVQSLGDSLKTALQGHSDFEKAGPKPENSISEPSYQKP